MGQESHTLVRGLGSRRQLRLGGTERNWPEVVRQAREADGAHHVGEDAGLEALQCHGLPKGSHGHLASPVVALAEVTVQAGRARDDDTAAVLLADHVGPSCLQNLEVPVHVDLNQVCKVLSLHDLEAVIVQHPSVGNDNVDLAILLQHKRHNIIGRCGNVAILSNSSATSSGNLCDHLVCLCARTIVHYDLRTARRQELREGAAQAASGTCDQRYLSIKAQFLAAKLLQGQRLAGKVAVTLEGRQCTLDVVHADHVLAETVLLQERLLQLEQRRLERGQVLAHIRLLALQLADRILCGRRVVDLVQIFLKLSGLILGGKGLVPDRAEVVSGELRGLRGLTYRRDVVGTLVVVPAENQDRRAVHALLVGVRDVISLIEGALLQAPRPDLPEGRQRVDALGHAAELAVLGVRLEHLCVPLVRHGKLLECRHGNLAHGVGELLRVLHHVRTPAAKCVQGSLGSGRRQHGHDVRLDRLRLFQVVDLPDLPGLQVGWPVPNH
mmetsp:Transcript_115645/g.307514  ORF Transcript_115645/g.307514 Transcript_115645/m.307514 type:complete len:497 (+) Transcript_115645:1185-2675(+)